MKFVKEQDVVHVGTKPGEGVTSWKHGLAHHLVISPATYKQIQKLLADGYQLQDNYSSLWVGDDIGCPCCCKARSRYRRLDGKTAKPAKKVGAL